MYGQTIPIADEGLQNVKSIYLCLHDGQEMGNIKRKLCDPCSTMKKRKEQHAENQIIMGESWFCAPCKVAGAW